MQIVRPMMLGLVLAACGEAPKNEGPEAWMGNQLHLVAYGTLLSEAFVVELDSTDAQNLETVACERDYVVTMMDGQPVWTESRLADFSITGFATVNGENRGFDLEFKSHDFQSDPAGTIIPIVPRDDSTEPGPSDMWFEWEWADEAGETFYEAAATTGSFTLEAFDGQPGDGGVVIPDGEGWVGGFVNARWSVSDSVRLSFSVRCGDNEIETIE